jgi:hypothetical protein
MRQLLDIINGPSVHSPGVELLLAKMHLPPPFGVLLIAKRARIGRLVAGHSKKSGDKFEIAADPKLDVDMFSIYVSSIFHHISPTILPGPREAKIIHPCRSTAPMQREQNFKLGIVA